MWWRNRNIRTLANESAQRMLDIQADERTLKRVMRVEIPEEVHLEIELK